jgi:V8-like Glu-specific endopeptidase
MKNFGRVVALSLMVSLVFIVTAIAGPSWSILTQSQSNEIRFTLQGISAEQMRVQVFALTGQRLFNSPWVKGAELRWSPSASLAKGLYLYTVRVMRSDGTQTVSALRKLALLDRPIQTETSLSASQQNREDEFDFSELVKFISSNTFDPSVKRTFRGVQVRLVGSGNLVEADAQEPEGRIEPGTNNPREVPANQAQFGDVVLRAFNTETLLEYEITLPKSVLDRVHKHIERKGLTQASQGVADPDAVESGRTTRPAARSNGVDNRVTFIGQTLTYPRRTIAHFSNNCTGALIGPRMIITVAHCINTASTNNWSSFTVRPGRDGATIPFGSSTIPTAGKAAWYFTPAPWRDPNQTGVQWDIGLIIIPDRLGDTTGWMGYAALPASELNAKSHYNRGYPLCNPNPPRPDTPVGCLPAVLYGDPSTCALGSYTNPGSDGWNRNIDHSCDTSAGHSGSPLYHYYFNQTQNTWLATVTMVHPFSQCDRGGTNRVCTSTDITPSTARRITPDILEVISWLKKTFP